MGNNMRCYVQSLCEAKGERSSKCLGDQGKHHGRNGFGRQRLFRCHPDPGGKSTEHKSNDMLREESDTTWSKCRPCVGKLRHISL